MDLMKNIQALIKQAEEAQANLSQDANAQMAQEQIALDAAAKQSGGTVEQQQVESLQKGLATPSAQAGAYDKVEAELDKAAALIELMDQGDSFYEAFEKVAEADMELQKQAAYETLVEAGMGFEEAVNLVKEAAEKKPYGYSEASTVSSKAGLRALGEGVAGMVGLGAAGAGIGRVIGAAKSTGSSHVLEHGAGRGRLSQLASKLGSKRAVRAGGIGTLAGAIGGLVGGVEHGEKASLANSLNDAHAKGRASK